MTRPPTDAEIGRCPHGALTGFCTHEECAQLHAERDDERAEVELLPLVEVETLPDGRRIRSTYTAPRLPGNDPVGVEYVDTLTIRFDVTGLTAAEVDGLTGEVLAQAEASELHPSVDVEVLP